MTTLADLIGRLPLDDPAASAEEMAVGLLAEILELDEPSLLVPLLVAAIAAAQRSRVRVLEHDAFRAQAREMATVTMAAPPDHPRPNPWATIEECERLLKLGSWMAHGKRVLWADATYEQHSDRVARLRRQQSGLQETIDNHLQAMATLSKAGVATLREVAERAA